MSLIESPPAPEEEEGDEIGDSIFRCVAFVSAFVRSVKNTEKLPLRKYLLPHVEI